MFAIGFGIHKLILTHVYYVPMIFCVTVGDLKLTFTTVT
jgi:hypothetical protein